MRFTRIDISHFSECSRFLLSSPMHPIMHYFPFLCHIVPCYVMFIMSCLVPIIFFLYLIDFCHFDFFTVASRDPCTYPSQCVRCCNMSDDVVDMQETYPGLYGVPPTGIAYDSANYANIRASVPDNMKAVFELIDQYKPESIELDTVLKPFITDYIPTLGLSSHSLLLLLDMTIIVYFLYIGQINPFLAPDRPDRKPCSLGITHLDEGALKQVMSLPFIQSILLSVEFPNQYTFAHPVTNSCSPTLLFFLFNYNL